MDGLKNNESSSTDVLRNYCHHDWVGCERLLLVTIKENNKQPSENTRCYNNSKTSSKRANGSLPDYTEYVITQLT